MAPFINLFNNQLQPANVFSANFNENSVVALLQGIRDNPGLYGLGQDPHAATLARAFVDGQRLLDIIVNPINVNNMNIRDLGAALGYLFFKQPVAQQNIEYGFRPILHVYARVLRAVSPDLAMSAVMFDATTSQFFYGATIPVLRNPRNRKAAEQANRLQQLKAALLPTPLPPVTKKTLRDLSKQLANVKVPDQAGANNRSAPENILVLYDNLITSLVIDSSGTYPMTLTFTNDHTAFNTARQNIINAELPAWRQAILAALTADAPFRVYLETHLQRSVGPEFGHCAETYPFIHIFSNVPNRAQTQGLAMIPTQMRNLTVQEINTGTTTYNTRRTFRYPCQNCTQVLTLAGMARNTFNSYIINSIIPNFDPNVT